LALKVRDGVSLEPLCQKVAFALSSDPRDYGKSTLLSIMGSLDRPMSGNVIWAVPIFRPCRKESLARSGGTR